jgi:cation transport protein ChaC
MIDRDVLDDGDPGTEHPAVAPPFAPQSPERPPRDFWIFAYGSLIWNPGFTFREKAIATLRGWHRAMCILSTHYRGCHQAPGLVLGLDHGGCCRGVAYRVDPDRAGAVKDYLDSRELITGVYHARNIPITLIDGRRVEAYVYIAKRGHPQYAGVLPAEAAARLIRQGCGKGGTSRDYLASTVRHLESLGLRDRTLNRLLRLVDNREINQSISI